MRLLAGVLFCLAALAQDKRPEFEVASIKPAAPDQRNILIGMAPGGRVNVTNMSLKDMIVLARRILPSQISGGASWMDTERYDIVARPEKTPAQNEIPLMIQSLLADRFQLKMHQETKEVAIYALVMARTDGKPGPQLIEAAEGSCQQRDPTNRATPPEPGKPLQQFCGAMRMGRGSLTGTSVPVKDLAPLFGRLLGRQVVDKTDLSGKYNISLEWTPDETTTMPPPPGFPAPPPVPAGNGPSLFAALQEQLGVKLESQKGPVEMFIIDSAARPTEN
jgi:uncharacterized protein (TIGR03435 family)